MRFLGLIFLLLCSSAIGQNLTEIDSLILVAKNYDKVDSHLVDKHNLLAYRLVQTNSAQALEHAQTALSAAREINYVDGIYMAYQYIGRSTYYVGSFNEALESYLVAEAEHAMHQDSTSLHFCKLQTFIGDVYWQMGNLELAGEYYQRSMVLSKNVDEPYQLANCLRNIGWVLMYQDKNDSALTIFLEAKEIFETNIIEVRWLHVVRYRLSL